MTYNPKLNAMLRALVTDEYFGNGAPNWIVSRGRPFERSSQTREGAVAQRRAEVRRLRWHANHENMPVAKELADILKNCKPGDRRFSAACSICNRALQRWYVDRGDTIRRQIQVRGQRPVILSLIPDFGRAPLSTLHDFDWDGFCRLTRDALKEAGIGYVYMCADASLNETEGEPGSSFFQFQLWGMVGQVDGTWREILKYLCNAAGIVTRPALPRG